MTRQQELNLELISLARHNNLNGKRIAKDLRTNLHLWVAAYGFHFTGIGIYHLIPLRDMLLWWHIDSIAITCKKSQKKDLINLIKKWKPHEIYVYKNAEDGFYEEHFLRQGDVDVLIKVWWD